MSVEIILYRSEDGLSSVRLRAEESTVWLTQLEIAELVDTTKHNVSLHIQNVLDEEELTHGSVVKESLTTAVDSRT